MGYDGEGNLEHALEFISKTPLPPECTDIYEFGVGNGTSFGKINLICNQKGILYRKIFGIDSELGLPTEDDVCRHEQFQSSQYAHKFSDITLDFQDYVLISNWFKDLTKQDVIKHDMKPAKLVHIDCDLYISSKDALSFLFKNQLVIPGTVIVFDEFKSVTDMYSGGESKAFFEIIKQYNVTCAEIWRNVYEHDGIEMWQNSFLVQSLGYNYMANSDSRYVNYINSLPGTFKKFYHRAVNTPPFDLPENIMGFGPSNMEWEKVPPLYQFSRSSESALMPILQYFASQCKSVTEFGCREGNSTAAFAQGLSYNPDNTLLTVDMSKNLIIDKFISYKDIPCKWTFIQANTMDNDFDIQDTDMLHIDDLHSYKHLKQELIKFGYRAKRFLSFHDTVSKGVNGENNDLGINFAIDEYVEENNWKLAIEVKFNHGLRIYEKTK